MCGNGVGPRCASISQTHGTAACPRAAPIETLGACEPTHSLRTLYTIHAPSACRRMEQSVSCRCGGLASMHAEGATRYMSTPSLQRSGRVVLVEGRSRGPRGVADIGPSGGLIMVLRAGLLRLSGDVYSGLGCSSMVGYACPTSPRSSTTQHSR